MRRKLAGLILTAIFFWLGGTFPVQGDKTNLPGKLPFKLERKDEGDPVTEKEIKQFTVRITGFWKKSDYFNWLLRTSHGVHPSTGKPDYSIWSDDIQAIKKGDTVTFQHVGRDENIMIPSCQILCNAIAGYLMSGNKAMGKLVEQYSKGITATMKGLMWDENDQVKYLMARNILVMNQRYVQDGGRKTEIDYTPMKNEEVRWNLIRLHYPHNPYWGDIYVTNMRSKDDAPHIFRAAGCLKYMAAYGKDREVTNAATEALEYLQGFAKDIVDSGYHIRTKDDKGKPYIPKADLASLVDYEKGGAQPECGAKLSASLIGYGAAKGNNCKSGEGGPYEYFATKIHYYNYKIIRGFHMSAVLHSLLAGENKPAYDLLAGLMERVDKSVSGEGHEDGVKNPRWMQELAVFLVQSASVGMPLTSKQVSIIHSEYNRALDRYEQFSRWDLWDTSVPDGAYSPDGGFRPDDHHVVRIEEIAHFLEYCYSPFRNPSGKAPVDCDIVKDPEKWGKG